MDAGRKRGGFEGELKAAVAAWGTKVSPASLQDNWRKCGHLAGMDDYYKTGFVGRQIDK